MLPTQPRRSPRRNPGCLLTSPNRLPALRPHNRSRSGTVCSRFQVEKPSYRKLLKLQTFQYMHPCVHSSTIHNSQALGKPPKCPLTDDWIKKMWYFIHNGILLNHKKKNKITPFAVIWLLGKLLYIEQINNKVLL